MKNLPPCRAPKRYLQSKWAPPWGWIFKLMASCLTENEARGFSCSECFMILCSFFPLFLFYLFLLPFSFLLSITLPLLKKKKRGLKVLSHALSPLLCVLSHFSLSFLCFCARPPSSCLCPGSLWSLGLSPALTLVPLSLTPGPCLSMALLVTAQWVLPLPMPWRWHHMWQEQAFSTA